MRLHHGELSISRVDEGLSIMLSFPLGIREPESVANNGVLVAPRGSMEKSSHRRIRSLNKVIPSSSKAIGSLERYHSKENAPSSHAIRAKAIIKDDEDMSFVNLNNSRVLVVDDSAMIRKMLIKMMNSFGHLCEEADDGDTAVKLVRTKPPFDLILMDNQMPRMTGQDAARIIRNELKFQGIILGVTGNVLPEDIQAFIECGADDVIIKPMTNYSFVEALSQALKKRHLSTVEDR